MVRKSDTFTFVSTMNQEYFDIVGTDMINSFLNYTEDFDLRIYAENINTAMPIDDRIDYYDWNVSCKSNWLEYTNKTTDNKNQKFAKKGFAFIHAMKTVTTKYLIWIDADMEFLQNTNTDIILGTIRKNLIGLFDHSYLGRGVNGYSAESGYVILNTTHKNYKKFVQLYENYYNMPTKPEGIENWWDGQICMLAASKFKKVHNLSNYKINPLSHTPINHSYLGKYITHHKGKKAKIKIKALQ